MKCITCRARTCCPDWNDRGLHALEGCNRTDEELQRVIHDYESAEDAQDTTAQPAIDPELRDTLLEAHAAVLEIQERLNGGNPEGAFDPILRLGSIATQMRRRLLAIHPSNRWHSK